MAKEIKLPKVSMGQTEGTISEWLVEEGTWVDKDQMVMVMETEKVAYELESSEAGYAVFQIELNETVPCGTVIILMAETEEELKVLLENKNSITEDTPQDVPQEIPQPVPNNNTIASVKVEEPTTTGTPSSDNEPFQSRRIKISPVAKVKAEVHNIDISKVKGSGPYGRIKICDIDDFIANRETTQKTSQSCSSSSQQAGSNFEKRVKKSIPLQGMRKGVSEQMMHSLHTAAQTSFMGEVDMSKIMKLRKRLNKKLEAQGDKIGFNDLLIYVMAKAIQKVPIVNSSLVDNEIIVWEDINIGLAVAIEINEYESGLYVPVVKQADRKSLIEISRESKKLIRKAIDNELSAEDTAGGTITLSPLGTVVDGYSTSTPVILQPQAYIINSGAIVDRIVPINGKPKVRPIMTLSMTFDHRIMDGVPALKFFNVMKKMMEDTDYLVL